MGDVLESVVIALILVAAIYLIGIASYSFVLWDLSILTSPIYWEAVRALFLSFFAIFVIADVWRG